MKTEKKAAHTPGPWKWSFGTYVIKSDEGRIIARTNIEHNEENADNARLIAAAPDLLNVAYVALGAFSAMVEDDPKDVYAKTWLKDVKAAIAKAEGK